MFFLSLIMTTRSQKKTIINSSKVNNINHIKHVENSWIMLIKDSLFDSFTIISLPHPGHNKPAKYCLDNVQKKIYEVVTFSEPYRSWFIGETVKSDGSLQIVTPVNPIFLVLPRLKEQCSVRAVPLEDLLSEKGFDKINNFISSLDCIGDLKGPPEIKAYKYNEGKTLDWLENKVRVLAKVLREKQIHVGSGAISATFVASNVSDDNVDEEFYLKYAHGMISEYLQEELADLLEKRFNFKPEIVECLGKKRKSEVTESNSNKKIKCESSEYIYKEVGQSLNKSISEVKKLKPLTAKEKARQKAAAGTKTISSFFTKK